MPFSRVVDYLEGPPKAGFFHVLESWICDGIQITVVKNAQEWFVVYCDNKIVASLGEYSRMFK